MRCRSPRSGRVSHDDRRVARLLDAGPVVRQVVDGLVGQTPIGSGTPPAADLEGVIGDLTHLELVRLCDRGVDVTGIDLSPAMVEEARRLHPGIGFRVGDMFALDVQDSGFAGIVAFYSIVHLTADSLPPAFTEMRRVLRPGGTLLVAFHVGDEVLRPGELWGVPITLDWTFFPLDVVVRALGSVGFLVTDVREREPYEGVEHASRRAYVSAKRPDAG